MYRKNSEKDDLLFLVGWLVGLFDRCVSTLFESFNAELDFKQFSLE